MFWLDSHPKSVFSRVCCWNIQGYFAVPKARNLRVLRTSSPFAANARFQQVSWQKKTPDLASGQISSPNICARIIAWNLIKFQMIFSAAERPQPTNQQQPTAHSPAILRKCVEKTWNKTRPDSVNSSCIISPSHCEPSSLNMPFTRTPKKDFMTSSFLIAILSHLNPSEFLEKSFMKLANTLPLAFSKLPIHLKFTDAPWTLLGAPFQRVLGLSRPIQEAATLPET